MQLTDRPELPGLFRYLDWLPVRQPLETKACPVTFQNDSLAKELGLANLWMTLTGWAPELGCYAKTGSFKELEAYPTLARALESQSPTVVVASAGNTGRAFAQAALETRHRVVLIVPEKSLPSLWTVAPPTDNVRLIAVSGDYAEAIDLSNRLCAVQGFIAEGGARNVARRDGMGTVMLNAACTIGHLPHSYVQAVGSGTGGIAAWEASERLLRDGRFGSALPRLHLIQNAPFLPMVSAWERGSREVAAADMPNAAASVNAVYSPVLTNRSPPYGVAGGVFDALAACGGEMSAVENKIAKEAFRLFEDKTGIDLDPAAAVALAGLIQACDNETVSRTETILLNLTGGGYQKIKEEFGTYPIEAVATVKPDISLHQLKEVLS